MAHEYEAERKKRRRNQQKLMVARLDCLLTQVGARKQHGEFKGAGPRSAGVGGRSIVHVLSDTIDHLLDGTVSSVPKQVSDSCTDISESTSFGPKALRMSANLSLGYREILMSGKTIVALEVENGAGSGEPLVTRLSAGAVDWFRDSPWPVTAGTRVRDLFDSTSWPVMEQQLRLRLDGSLRNAGLTGSSSSALELSSPQLQVPVARIAHFSRHRYIKAIPSMHWEGGAGAAYQERWLDVVEYVQASAHGWCIPQQKTAGKATRQDVPHDRGGVQGPAEAATRTLIVFELPTAWQWKPDAGQNLLPGRGIDQVHQATRAVGHAAQAAAGGGNRLEQTLGRWRNVMDDAVTEARVTTLQSLMGEERQFIGCLQPKMGIEWIRRAIFVPRCRIRPRGPGVASELGGIDARAVQRAHALHEQREISVPIATPMDGELYGLVYSAGGSDLMATYSRFLIRHDSHLHQVPARGSDWAGFHSPWQPAHIIELSTWSAQPRVPPAPGEIHLRVALHRARDAATHTVFPAGFQVMAVQGGAAGHVRVLQQALLRGLGGAGAPHTGR